MSGIATIGYAAIAVAFVATTLTGISATIAALGGRPRFRIAAEYGAYLVSTLFGVAATAMIHAFIHQDYSLLYVYKYSDASMPWIYQLAAFWGGQAGSLMFWALILSLLMALVTVLHRKRDAALMPWVIAIMCSVLFFFTALLLFVGQGLNPQLQTFTMVVHPPSLLTGYVAATVPFAFAMAALLSGRVQDDGWLKATRKWTLICWGFLTIGLILGMLWAYTELGWGGYWAWDPVENAAFIPWLVLTAFLHSAVVQEKRGMLKRWNMFLVLLAWLLTIFGTFLTRSGLIASVHSFAQSEIGDYFLWYLLAMTIVCVVALARQWQALKSENEIRTPLSREFAFLFNNWILLFAAGVVLVGTLFPKLKEYFTGSTATLGPTWFNAWMAPIGLAMLALMGVGVVISWRRASVKNFKKNFVRPLIFSTVATIALPALYWWLRLRSLGVTPTALDTAYSLLAVFCCAFAFSTIFVEFWRGTKVRMSKLGVGPFTALTGLVVRNQRRYGGYIVHLGLAALMFGFVGNAVTVQEEVIMRPGETAPLGDYEVELTDAWEENDPEKVKFFARVELSYDGELVDVMKPGRFFYHAPQSGTSEVDVRSTPFEDVYFAVINYDLGDSKGPVVALLMEVYPFVWWVWIGGIVMVFGTLLCLWPVERRTRRPRRRKRSKSTLVGIVAILAWPVLLLAFEGSARADEAPPEPQQAEQAEKTLAEQTRESFDPAVKHIFGRIKCQCEACQAQGATLAQCKPTCGEGRRDRSRVVALYNDGHSEDEIVDIFREERGESAVTAPATEGFNNVTWLIPVVGGVVTIPLIVFAFARRSRRRDSDAAPDDSASAPERDDDDDAHESDESDLDGDLLDDPEISDDDAERLERLERTLEDMD